MSTSTFAIRIHGFDFECACVRVSGRGSKRSPARTTDVVMDTTDENETRIALVSFSSSLGLQLMLTLKTCSVKKKKKESVMWQPHSARM